MDFRYKCMLQKFFSRYKQGIYLNFFFQKYITKNLPISSNHFIETFNNKVTKHFEIYSKYTTKEIADSTYYEFGAGWDLLAPIGFSCKNFKTLHCIDVRKMIFPELINNTVKLIKTFENNLNLKVPSNIPTISRKNIETILKDFFRIFYKAPCDARETKLPENSVDLIISNVTFEHIRKNIILDILAECFRILNKGGIASFIIDYQDHWSYFDKSISVYNFLIFSENDWSKYNPALHYQNRLRHKDYIDLIKMTGFKILEVSTQEPSNEDLIKIRDLQLHPDFAENNEMKDLAIKSSHIVLSK